MAQISHDGIRWSNADADRIVLSEYNPQWTSLFAEEAQAIQTVIGNDFEYHIEHFGSTAIPGMTAKPIIDIMLVVPDQEVWSCLITRLEKLGYVYWADNPQTDRMFFVKGMPPYGTGRTHHVHVRKKPDDEILFRDYLISHPEEASRYEQLKRDLAKRYPTAREAYTNGKSELVKEILERALSSIT